MITHFPKWTAVTPDCLHTPAMITLEYSHPSRLSCRNASIREFILIVTEDGGLEARERCTRCSIVAAVKIRILAGASSASGASGNLPGLTSSLSTLRLSPVSINRQAIIHTQSNLHGNRGRQPHINRTMAAL